MRLEKSLGDESRLGKSFDGEAGSRKIMVGDEDKLGKSFGGEVESGEDHGR